MSYRPPRLLMQWHVTNRCNLRCSHCYQDNFQEHGLPFDYLLGILEQFKSFLNGGRIPGHITVTGGEPFVRDDFPALLDIFAEHREYFSFAVLTNGTLIDEELAARLGKWNPSFVQVSLEGGQGIHDRIRGQGNYQRTVAAVQRLVQNGVKTLISFTAQKSNYLEFPKVARLGRELGVSRVWADRIIPETREQRDQVLSPEETREFFEIMRQQREQMPKRAGCMTEIAMKRALQFLVSDDEPYRCTAGDTLITVMPNGDVYPCRRMPIRVGNLLETPLAELYDCARFRALREPGCASRGCESCAFAGVCRGGLRCLAYALNGSPDHADPGCWLAG